MRLKIGLVTGEYPPMEGGVGAFTQALAKALAGAGHQVHVVTSRAARPPGAESDRQDLLEPVESEDGLLHPVVRRWRWPALAQVADVAERYELDVINIQYQPAAYDMRSPAANLLPWRLKGLVKTVVTFHDLRVPYLFPKAGRLRKAAVLFMARQAHGVIVTNAADYQALIPNLQSPLCLIPIGSNIEVYQPNHIEVVEARELLGLNEGDCLLGYFGFVHESKGADRLVRALAQLDERFHLVFIGGRTGSSDSANNEAFLSYLEALIAELDLTERVHWTGFLVDMRVSTYLHAADMLVMPYRDGASLRRGTLMAALAHGRPLITTVPATPTPELVHGQNVWLVPVDDLAALREGIQQIAAEPALRERLARGAAGVAELFTWDRIAEKTAAFFQEIVITGTTADSEINR